MPCALRLCRQLRRRQRLVDSVCGSGEQAHLLARDHRYRARLRPADRAMCCRRSSPAAPTPAPPAARSESRSPSPPRQTMPDRAGSCAIKRRDSIEMILKIGEQPRGMRECPCVVDRLSPSSVCRPRVPDDAALPQVARFSVAHALCDAYSRPFQLESRFRPTLYGRTRIQKSSRRSARSSLQGLTAASDDAEFEADFNAGALAIEFEDPPAKFVVSPNSPVRQIWVSAHSKSYKLDWDDVGKYLRAGRTPARR